MSYVLDKDQLPLYPCEVCGNDLHRECLATFLGMEPDDLSNDLVKETLNPTGFQGNHYICHLCAPTRIPSKTTGMTKIAKKKAEKENKNSGTSGKQSKTVVVTTGSTSVALQAITAVDDDDNIRSSQIPSTSSGNPPLMESAQRSCTAVGKSAEEPTKSTTTEVTMESSTVRVTEAEGSQREEEAADGWSYVRPNICRNFLKENCRHGMSGKTKGTCKFFHPKMCNKFMKHGTRDGIGCNKGKKCENFHPKMCSLSLAKGECFSRQCNLKHVRGTKRIPGPRREKPNRTRREHASNNNENRNPDQDFQSVLHGMETTIMKSVEEKITAGFADMVKLIQTSLTVNQPLQQSHVIQQNPVQMQTTVQRIPQYPLQHQFPMMQCQSNQAGTTTMPNNFTNHSQC